MDYSVNNITELGEKTKRNYSELPVIDFFRIDIGGVSDTDTKTQKGRHVTVYEIMVQCHGCGHFRRDTDVAGEKGMKLPHNSYKTKEAAFAAALEYKAKWGKPTSKSGKKSEEAKTKAVEEAKTQLLDNLRSALSKMGLNDVAINAIIANTVQA